MNELSGRLTARLADQSETYEQELVDEINRRVNPPKPIALAEVFIRAMYIVSDQINSQGGKFEEPELDQLADLMPDAPVMIGHRRDSLPVARNFFAIKTVMDGRVWIKSYFYWMKDSEGAEDLRRNIDGGIYKEGSISFLFQFPQCSICGEDIRRCSHIPFREYENRSGETEIAHFLYRRIERVLETSLVFRGAIPHTHITDKLDGDGESPDTASTRSVAATLFTKFESPDAEQKITSTGFRDAQIIIENDVTYIESKDAVIYPYQPGLAVRVSKRGDDIEFESTVLLPEAFRLHLSRLVKRLKVDHVLFDALIYGTRGKDRVNGFGLMRLIDAGKDVHRLHLRVMDVRSVGDEDLSQSPYAARLRRIESMKAEFGKAGIECIRPRDRESCRAEYSDPSTFLSQHIYGIEIVVESESGQLKRHIIGRERLAPVVVKKLFTKPGNIMVCHVESFGGECLNNMLTGRFSPALSMGDVLLAETAPAKKGLQRLVKVYDILPGVESHNVAPAATTEDTGTPVHFNRDGQRLLISFELDGVCRRVTVYHFNQKMFAEGRRFIAEMRSGRPVDSTENSQAIETARISRCGKLILVKSTLNSDTVENTPGFWLRPVLIDGEERYLFYAAGVNCSPGEL